MDNKLCRPSVTIDEAVAILLKWVDGPVEYTCAGDNPSYEDQEAVDSMRFDLQEYIEGEECSLENNLEDAKDDKLSAAIVAEKREALNKFRKQIQQANTCLSEIHDQLIRGDQPGLTIDTKLSSSSCRYITLASLARWAKMMKYPVQILADMPVCLESTDQLTKTTKGKTKPRRKMLDQVDAIKAEIRKLGHDPKNLPINNSGKEGIKAHVRTALEGCPLFEATTSFKKAWEQVNRDARAGLD